MQHALNGYMGQFNRAALPPPVFQSYALRKTTGGVTDENTNQAAPGGVSNQSARYPHKKVRVSGKWGNSTGLLYCPVFHLTPCGKGSEAWQMSITIKPHRGNINQ